MFLPLQQPVLEDMERERERPSASLLHRALQTLVALWASGWPTEPQESLFALRSRKRSPTVRGPAEVWGLQTFELEEVLV